MTNPDLPDVLSCICCGQSNRTLAELIRHMKQNHTEHEILSALNKRKRNKSQ